MFDPKDAQKDLDAILAKCDEINESIEEAFLE